MTETLRKPVYVAAVKLAETTGPAEVASLLESIAARLRDTGFVDEPINVNGKSVGIVGLFRTVNILGEYLEAREEK